MKKIIAPPQWISEEVEFNYPIFTKKGYIKNLLNMRLISEDIKEVHSIKFAGKTIASGLLIQDDSLKLFDRVEYYEIGGYVVWDLIVIGREPDGTLNCSCSHFENRNSIL